MHVYLYKRVYVGVYLCVSAFLLRKRHMLLPWIVLFPGILSLIFPIFFGKHPQLSTTELFLVTFIYLGLGFLVNISVDRTYARVYMWKCSPKEQNSFPS